MEDKGGAYRALVGGLMERDLLEYLHVDGSKLKKKMFKKWDGDP
jgi:hypothetical protein